MLDEDFNDGNITNWTIEDSSDDGYTWELISNRNNSTLDGTEFIIVDSDIKNGVHFQEGLLTPAINIPSPQGQLILTFDHFYNHLSSLARVDVFDGNDWIEGVLSYSEDVGVWNNPASEEVDITQYANDKLKIRFYYDDNNSWAWYWAIDNVKIKDVIN